MQEEYLLDLHPTLWNYIRKHFCLWSENDALMASCLPHMGDIQVGEDGASAIIIRELWERLNDSHKIRLLK